MVAYSQADVSPPAKLFFKKWFTRTQSFTSYVFIEKLKVKAGESGHNTSKAPWIEQDLYK